MRTGRLLRLIALVPLTVALVSCGGGKDTAKRSTKRSTSTHSTSTTAKERLQAARVAQCAVRKAPSLQPVTDPNGPYYHQVRVGRLDGTTVTGDTLVADHASVPDAMKRDDGILAVYYISGATGVMHVGTWDGTRFTEQGPVTIDDAKGAMGAVDPDVMRLDNGRYRLTYALLAPPAPPSDAGAPPASSSPLPTGTHPICVAESDDGEHFTTSAVIYQREGITDPSLTRSGGVWFLAVSHGSQTYVARSDDGATFADVTTVSAGGVPELAAIDGGLRLYVCGNNGGIVALDSHDEGRTWDQVGTAVPQRQGGLACDPSLAAGTDVFFYKTQGPH